MFINGAFKTEISIGELKLLQGSNKHDLEEIINQLDELSRVWRVGGEFYNKALFAFSKDSSFSLEMIKDSLAYIPLMLSKESLYKRIKSNFGDEKLLDSFVQQVQSRCRLCVKAKGKLLHITAGNVFLGAIDSLLMGLITKNTNIVKLGSSNQIFPRLFCESLSFISEPSVLTDHICFMSWEGGDLSFEKQITSVSDAVIIWGGAEVIRSYRNIIDLDKSLIEFGPKLSFGVVDSAYYDLFRHDIFNAIATDVFTWNQSACSNAQSYFLDSSIDIEEFLESLYNTFLDWKNKELNINSNSQVDRLKEKQRASYSNFIHGKRSYYHKDFIISYKGKENLTLSVLNQTININIFENLEDLLSKISPMKYYFQTCGLGILNDRDLYLSKLSQSGVKRFTDVGNMTVGLDGTPHDGVFPLRELVYYVSDESEVNLTLSYHLLQDKIPYFEDSKNKNISSSTLQESSINHTDLLLNKEIEPGLFFTSGGTTGLPKYSYYSFKDLDRVSYALSENFISLGLGKTDVVANLFMAGNLWSSFISTQKVLENIGCNILPIGGAVNDQQTVKYLLDFKVTSIAGIPTKILSIAKYILDHDITLILNTIFYAGERFGSENLKLVEKAFKCTQIYSAGYASVDCGLIGVQTKECSKDEHILVDGVTIKSKNDKIFVSSNMRANMPVINYELEDKLIFDKHNPRKFKLSGRTDRIIQIWGCRFTDKDLLMSLPEGVNNIQFLITKDETIEIISKSEIIDPSSFVNKLMSQNQDVRNTVSTEYLLDHFIFRTCDSIRNIKTGKTPLVIDQRFSSDDQ